MLVISSATKNAYIAIEHGDKKCFAKIDANCKQSENVLVAINNLLEQNEIDIDEINDFAVIVGPGSFTGIRIGIALVKGLCAGKGVEKVIAVSTLELMAKQISKTIKPNEEFACAIDALSDLVYLQIFNAEGMATSKPQLVTKEQFENLDVTKFGLEEESICDKKIDVDVEKFVEIANELSKTNIVDIKKLEPIYLRKSQAEENLKKNKKTS